MHLKVRALSLTYKLNPLLPCVSTCLCSIAFMYCIVANSISLQYLGANHFPELQNPILVRYELG